MARIWLSLLMVAAVLAAPAIARAAPNIVVIETDDQTVSDMAAMPQTQRLIGRRGVTFTQSIVSLSQCCPSRATFLTGQYAHNHHVYTTQPPFGGYSAFDPSQSLALWLQHAGYSTALVGKYFNQYGAADPTTVPPGWTDWRALEGPDVYRYYGFRMNFDGDVRRFDGVYKTDLQTNVALDVIRRRLGRGAPLFLWLTYVAPHNGDPPDIFDLSRWHEPVPSLLHSDQFAGAPMPHGAAFDEADVSDKPPAIRRRPRLGVRAQATVQLEWERRRESLQSVDDGVARIFAALRARHALSNTLVIFTSDNGYLLGEHRIRFGKVLPYEPSIRVPLLMRGPGVPAGQLRSQLVWNGDLAPTIAMAAGARAPWQFDGRSLWPFVRASRARDDRAVVLEGPPRGTLDATPTFTGLRSRRHTYVEYATGERELYDLERDPDELENLAGRPESARLQARLARLLAALRHCSGAACRQPG